MADNLVAPHVPVGQRHWFCLQGSVWLPSDIWLFLDLVLYLQRSSEGNLFLWYHTICVDWCWHCHLKNTTFNIDCKKHILSCVFPINFPIKKKKIEIGHLAACIKTVRTILPVQSPSSELKQVLHLTLCFSFEEPDQYSQREDASTVVPSPMSVPPWSPRRYLPSELLIATRPCSRNSRKKSSGFSPSEHTRSPLETYQNFPFTPAGAQQWLMCLLHVGIASVDARYLF